MHHGHGEYTILPVFFASFLHIAFMILVLSVSELGSGSFSPAQDTSLAAISIKARTVTISEPPKPAPAPTSEPKVSVKKDAKAKQQAPAKEAKTSTEQQEAAAKEKTQQQDSAVRSKSQQDLSALERSTVLAFYGRNKNLVERNFNTGSEAQRDSFVGLVVRLKLFLDEHGRLVKVDLVKASGSDLFDAEALRAVKRVSKFIIPNDIALRNKYFREINMEFKLD